MYDTRYKVIWIILFVADKDIVKKYKKNVIVGVTQIHQIKEIVDNLFHLNSISLPKSSSSSIPPLQLPKIRKDKDIEILPISLGCNGSCTFCQTKLARGNLRSYPMNEIINRIREVLFFKTCLLNSVRNNELKKYG